MFGDNYLKKAKFQVTEEGYKAFNAASEAVSNLANATGKGWHLTSCNAFDKARYISFAQGAASVLGGMTAAWVVQNIRKKRLENKLKRLKEENQRLEEEAGL